MCGYAITNSLGRGLNVSFRYDGSYLTNMVYALPNGNQFALNLSRKVSRQDLVTLREYSFGAQSVYWYSTDYDLIGRPTNATDSVSLMRDWSYNNRSELAAASIGTNLYGYSYDTIGNRLWSAANTNTYIANALNQYTLVGRAAPSVPQTTFAYDADGNMTRDDRFLYSYDAENRLRSVTSRSMTNGALRVLNAYDHRNRRIRKTVQRLSVSVAQPPALPIEIREWQTLEAHTFVWDGNNIVLEKVEFADGTTRTFEYFWGLDKSGTEQGAGGVEGLLAVSMDGIFYIPCYDHNGNIVLYISETGATAAQYTYDPCGNIIESSGPLADAFSFGFSTKYHDREIGMISYKRRVLRPDFGRWLNRDPIEEDGGVNLYAFCDNSPPCNIDTNGCAYIAYRRLDNLINKLTGVVWSPEKELKNRVWAHQHIFFEDGKTPSNIGFFDDGVHSDSEVNLKAKWFSTRTGLKDSCLRKAVSFVRPLPYSLFGDKEKGIVQYNCQDWIDDVLSIYDALLSGKTYYPKSTLFIEGRK